MGSPLSKTQDRGIAEAGEVTRTDAYCVWWTAVDWWSFALYRWHFRPMNI